MSPPPLCNTGGGVTIVTPPCAIVLHRGGDNCHPPPVQYFAQGGVTIVTPPKVHCTLGG